MKLVIYDNQKKGKKFEDQLLVVSAKCTRDLHNSQSQNWKYEVGCAGLASNLASRLHWSWLQMDYFSSDLIFGCSSTHFKL